VLGPCATIPKEECGKWELPPLEKWRDRVNGYTSGIVFAKQQPLGANALLFAQYLNAVHNAVHVWYADRFLEWLDRQRPRDDPMNDPKIVTRLEIGIAPDGQIAHMGVVRSSGVEAFDASALEAFARGAPFGETPPKARSADGNLWVHWEFRRDEVYACSTMNARPFMFGN
jgi:TonB family protein